MADRFSTIGEAFLKGGFSASGLKPEFKEDLQTFLDEKDKIPGYFRTDFRNDLSNVLFGKGIAAINRRNKLLVGMIYNVIRNDRKRKK